MYIPEKGHNKGSKNGDGPSPRIKKHGKELMRFVSQKLVGGVFQTRSKLPHPPMITITKVDLTPNMRQAYIYFRNFDKNKPEVILAFLTRISGELSQQWAKQATAKYTPSFEFVIDIESETEKLMNSLFDKIRAEDPTSEIQD